MWKAEDLGKDESFLRGRDLWKALMNTRGCMAGESLTAPSATSVRFDGVMYLTLRSLYTCTSSPTSQYCTPLYRLLSQRRCMRLSTSLQH